MGYDEKTVNQQAYSTGSTENRDPNTVSESGKSVQRPRPNLKQFLDLVERVYTEQKALLEKTSVSEKTA